MTFSPQTFTGSCWRAGLVLNPLWRLHGLGLHGLGLHRAAFHCLQPVHVWKRKV